MSKTKRIRVKRCEAGSLDVELAKLRSQQPEAELKKILEDIKQDVDKEGKESFSP